MTQRTTLASISRDVTSEAHAYAYFEQLRWGDTPVCAHCDSTDVALIKGGAARRTRTGAISERRVWNCRTCRKQFSVLTNTVMHGTKIPVRTWLMVTFEMCADKNGVSAREVERKYGIAGRSAWFMLHRIREAMAAPYETMFHGIVMADETYVGGDPKNRHAAKRGEVRHGRATEKTPVVSLIDAETGEVRSHVTTNVDGYKLAMILAGNVDTAGSVLVTDEFRSYLHPGSWFAKHERLNHSKGEYARDGYSTNRVEGYFSQLKRSIDGTHHRVSVEHLHRYVAEHDYRYTTRHMTDADRMADLAKHVAGRLTYKVTKTKAWPLAGREGQGAWPQA